MASHLHCIIIKVIYEPTRWTRVWWWSNFIVFNLFIWNTLMYKVWVIGSTYMLMGFSLIYGIFLLMCRNLNKFNFSHLFSKKKHNKNSLLLLLCLVMMSCFNVLFVRSRISLSSGCQTLWEMTQFSNVNISTVIFS